MLHSAHGLNRRKMIAVALPVALQDDHDLAGVAARAPQPIIVVLADGRRQAITRAIEINRGGVAPAVAEDGRARLLVRRQAVIDAGYLAHHLFPAELVGKVL